MPKSDSAIKINYMCMLVKQMQSYKKEVDSRTLMMFTMMISYFLLAVGFKSLKH